MDLNFGSYIPRLFQIESGGNPYNRTGSNRGLGQFGPQEEQQYGITNWLDPQQQVSAVQREAQTHIPLLTNTLGRPPSPGELYLAHQQGASGGPALLSANPDLPAWQVIRPFYKSDAIAKKAISGNIPSNSALSGIPSEMITAGDFRNLWVNKFEGGNAPSALAYAPSSGTSMANGTTQHQPMSFGNMIGSNQNAILGYLAGALQGGNLGQSIGRGIGGFLGGQNLDIQHQAMGAAAQGLAGMPGMNPAMAQAIAANPQYLQAFMATQPQFKTITDALGQQVPVWVNPMAQTVTPVGQPGAAPPGGAGTPGGGAGGPIPTYLDQNQPLYPQLHKPQQAIVDSMLAGRMPMPSAFALKTPYWQTLIGAANEKAQEQGGTFDAVQWGQRNKTALDFSTGGQSGKSINALDTVEGHIEKLSNAVEKLNNSDFPLINAARNVIANQTGFDKGRRDSLQQLQDSRKAVIDEMSRAYKAGYMSDTEIREWGSLINAADSKPKMQRALADFTELLNTKRQQLVNQHKDIMGFEPKGLNNAQNERVTKLVHDRLAGVAPEAAPQGGAQNAPQAAPQAPRAPQSIPAPHLRQIGNVYPTPKGPMIWRGNGWEPATNANSL